MYWRNINQEMTDALSDSPVVLLNGARQTGKSTLLQSRMDVDPALRYATLDDATVLASALRDPQGFLAGFDGPVALDEVQREPALFPAIKLLVDRNRQPGRFLLTGSADIMLLPKISESLAGRMQIITLWPFSQGELAQRRDSFVDRVFADRFQPATGDVLTRDAVLDRMVTGGFPEAVARTQPRRRGAWFDAYITAILQRDVRDLANIEHLAEMPRLLRLLAARTSSLYNAAELSRSLGLPASTLKRYVTLLETTFLVQFVPPWSANLGKRIVRAPKLMMTDTGLAAHLLGIASAKEIPDRHVGPLVENFAAMELRKQVTWSDTRATLHHLRVQSGQEADLLLEDARGNIVAIEVKAASQVSATDFRHLRAIRDWAGDRFVRGVVLYLGESAVPFGDAMHAVPISALWAQA